MLYISPGPCLLYVGVIGINFKTADLRLREAIARGAQSLAGEKSIFFRHPTVLLSTCNRTEIYFYATELAEAHSDLLALLRSLVDEPFDHRLYSYFGIDCFAHLCRVTSGLDSAILAETEIQRQVKVAYERSTEFFSLPSCIHYVFQKALKVGKAVRSELELEQGAPTLFSTLWEIGQERWSDLRSKRILLVGYSEINRGFARFLSQKGVRGFTFSTRNPAAVRCEGAVVCDRTVLKQWDEYDLIVSASQAEEYLIRGKSHRDPLIFDLSVPRTVDPDLALFPSIQLFNIEQVNQIIEQKRKGQKDCLEKCEALVWEHVIRLSRIYRTKTETALARSFS